MGLLDRIVRPKPERGDVTRVEVSARLLKGGGRVDVVIGARHQAALELIAGGTSPASRDIQVLAILVLQPGDPLSENIGVQVKGAKVGYLPRDAAKDYRRALEALREDHQVGMCFAHVTQGPGCDDGGAADFRVILDLAPPERVLDEISPEAEALFEQLWEEQEG